MKSIELSKITLLITNSMRDKESARSSAQTMKQAPALEALLSQLDSMERERTEIRQRWQEVDHVLNSK